MVSKFEEWSDLFFWLFFFFRKNDDLFQRKKKQTDYYGANERKNNSGKIVHNSRTIFKGSIEDEYSCKQKKAT